MLDSIHAFIKQNRALFGIARSAPHIWLEGSSVARFPRSSFWVSLTKL